MTSFSSQTFTPDNLVAGDYPVVTEAITVLDGQTLSRGDLLGKVTASGKYIKSLAAADDGSETPVIIVAEDVAASGADVVTTGYLTGEFNENQVGFGAGHTAANTKDVLRSLGIFLKSAQAA